MVSLKSLSLSLLFFAIFSWAPCLRIGIAQRAHVKQTRQH